jgi:pseudouridine kinase
MAPVSLSEMSKPVVCIGAAFVDELFHTHEPILPATTNPASVSRTPGGVARNIAHQLARLDVSVQLIAAFGNDPDGEWLRQQCLDAGMHLDGALTIEGQTGRYTGILAPDGSLFTAFLTHSPVHHLTPEYLARHEALLETASHILGCANLLPESLSWLLAFSRRSAIPFIIEPVSVPPARRMAELDLEGLYLVTPNEDELPALCRGSWHSTREQVDELLQRGIRKVWLHSGAKGSVIYSREGEIRLPATRIEVKDCTGAGDGSVAGYLLGKTLGRDDAESLRIAHTLSAEILQVDGANVPDMDRSTLLSLTPRYYPDAAAAPHHV